MNKLAVILGLVAAPTWAQPYITYDNGTIYELGPQERVFISTDDVLYRPPMFRRSDGAQVFAPVAPEAMNDTPFPLGSEGWCANLESQLTGVYDFQAVTYNKYCKAND